MKPIKCSVCEKEILNPTIRQIFSKYQTCGSVECLDEADRRRQQEKYRMIKK